MTTKAQASLRPSPDVPRAPRPFAQSDKVFAALTSATFAAFAVHLWFVFYRTPQAQEAAGGITQKIFYFHVPAAYALYLSGFVCFVASAGYLVRRSRVFDSWAKAGAECAVAFGAMVLVSGPLWAKKAWGVYWVWDPRLTSLLLAVMVYAALVIVRAFGGAGEVERRFAAALGVLGTTLLPIIHYSVQLWGGNHPTVVGRGGGGLSDPAMVQALLMGFGTMTALAAILLYLRAAVANLSTRLADAEQYAAALDLYRDE